MSDEQKKGTDNGTANSDDEATKGKSADAGGTSTAGAEDDKSKQASKADGESVSPTKLIKAIGGKIRDFNGDGKVVSRNLKAGDVLSFRVSEDGKSANVVLIDGSKHTVEL